MSSRILGVVLLAPPGAVLGVLPAAWGVQGWAPPWSESLVMTPAGVPWEASGMALLADGRQSSASF